MTRSPIKLAKRPGESAEKCASHVSRLAFWPTASVIGCRWLYSCCQIVDLTQNKNMDRKNVARRMRLSSNVEGFRSATTMYRNESAERLTFPMNCNKTQRNSLIVNICIQQWQTQPVRTPAYAVRQLGFAVSNETVYHSLPNTSRITMCVRATVQIPNPVRHARECSNSTLTAAEVMWKVYARRMGQRQTWCVMKFTNINPR